MTKARPILAVTAIAVGLGWILLRSLGGSLVYFMTPTELLTNPRQITGNEVRVGGQVLPGSTHRSPDGLTFILTDGTTRLTVIYTGAAPALFRSGTGAVVEGRYGSDGALHADTLLVKHSSEYRPPAPGQTPTSAVLGGG